MKAGNIAKTCGSNFYCFKCKGRHHVSLCMVKNAGGNQNSHGSKNSSGNGFTQIVKQNDGDKKTTGVSQNIVSVHPSLNLYHVSSVLLKTARAQRFSDDFYQ